MKYITHIFFYTPFIIILLTLSLTPNFQFLDDLNAYDEKRIFQIAALILIGISTVLIPSIRNRSYATVRTAPKTLKVLISVFFILGILSVTVSNSPRHAFLDITLFALLFLMASYISSVVFRHPKKSSEWLMTAFIFAIALHFSVFVHQFILVLKGVIPFSFYTLFTGFVNPRFENQWEGMILPIILGTAIFYRNQSRKTFYFLLFLGGFIWMNIMFSTGRGVILATLMGVVFTGLIFKAHRTIWWRINFIALVMGLTLYGLAIMTIYLTTDTFTAEIQELADSSSSGRLSLWASALQLVSYNPFIGIGPMQFALFENNIVIAAHPHNIILQLLAEWGLIATLLILGVAIYSFTKWCHFSRQKTNKNPESTILYTALTTAFIVGNIHGLLSGVWIMPLSQLTLIIIIGWMHGLYRQKAINIKYASTPYAFIALILIVLTTFIYSLYPELSNLPNWIENSFKATGYSLLHPRFWSQGYIF